MKKVLSFFLAICLLLSLVPAVQIRAAADTIIYLDPVAGDDTADGLTEETALGTYNTAYGKIKDAGGGTIVLLDTINITSDMTLPKSASTVPVVLTSKTGAEGISANTNVRFNAPTTLQNITMTLTAASSGCTVYGEGKKLTIGENVTTVPAVSGENTYYFSLSGGKRWYYTAASTDLTVQSGTWRNIYVGTYGYKKSGVADVSKVTGNAKLTMTGGQLTGFITPAYSSSSVIGGDVDIYLSNASVATIYAAPAYTASVGGDVNITLGEGAVVTGSVFTGGLGSGSVAGKVNITLDGADTTGYDRISNVYPSSFTGSVGGATVTLKSGKLTNTISGFDHVAVDIPEGKTLTINKYSVTADTVQSAGTLAFSSTGKLTAASVTGTVNCEVTDQVRYAHAYITAPAGSGFVFADDAVTENNGVWINEDSENFRGLVLSGDEGVTVTLYSGFDETTTITPYRTENNTKYYPNVSGKYRVKASRSGYITQYENIYVSDAESLTRMEKHYSLVQRDKAWDPEYARKLTDEALASLPSDPSLWPEYAPAFTTPVFTKDRPMHKYTTQTEMEAFIAGLDTADDKMYVYSLGTTKGTVEFNIPLVIFTETDLSGAKTLEEAAALIDGNGKLTVHYQAQIHGNEPAGGEAALGMIAMMDTQYGDKLLDKMNVYIIPRLNPDGAYQDKRVIPNVSKDPNRDYMNLETYEVERTIYAMNLFHPEAVVDGHEYTVNLNSTSIGLYDILIHSERHAYATDPWVEQADGIARSLFASMEENNLGYGWYNNYLGGASSNIGTSYTMQRGYYSVLLESYGIYAGTQNMARRVAAQVSAMDGVLQYLHENAEAANKAVNDQWDLLVQNGKKYNDNDPVYLKATAQAYPSLDIEDASVLNLVTGAVTTKLQEAKAVTAVTRSRENATAYLVPADHAQIDYILKHVEAHGLTYYRIPAGAAVMAQHVGGDTTEAILTDEQATIFANGAYVFGMDQRYARILAYLMEPDVNQNADYSSSFAQAGVFTLENGEYPVYRYVRDLNSEGKVDYSVVPDAPTGLTGTAPTGGNNDGVISGLDAAKLYEYRLDGSQTYTPVAAGATQITGLAEGKYYIRLQAADEVVASQDTVIALYSTVTVYIDQTNGSDDNDGYTEATAVKSINKAYTQLSARMEGTAKDTVATIMVLAMHKFTSKIFNFPSHSYPVVITSKTGAEGFNYTYTPSSTSSTNGEWNLNGPTTFRNITLTNGGKDNYVYLTAGGNKLVIESSVTVTESGKRFMLAGGRKDGASTNVDVTVAGGRFDVIYLATHKGTHNGPINFNISGVNAFTVTPSYSGSVTGDINLSVNNARIKTIYMGNTSTNNVTGNVTVTLGEGVTSTTDNTGTIVYAGSRDSGNVIGKATVIADGIDLTASSIYGTVGKTTNTGTIGSLKLVVNKGQLADVAANFITKDGTEVVLGCDQTEDITISKDVYLDLNGYSVTGQVTVSSGATLYGMDSQTDDYTVADGVYGKLTQVSGKVLGLPEESALAKDGYMMITENGEISFHRVNLQLKAMTLRPEKVGVYYKSDFACDEMVAKKVLRFGVVLSVRAVPTAENLDSDCKYTSINKEFTSGGMDADATSTLLKGIMKPNNGLMTNNRNATMPIFGRAYIFTEDGYMFGGAAQRSLQEQVEGVNDIWESLGAEQKEAVVDMYDTYADVMKDWDIPNIQAAA